MLGIIITSILTVLGGYGVALIKDMQLFKDIADEGYLLDLGKVKEMNAKITEATKIDGISHLKYPFVGLIIALFDLGRYYCHRNQILSQLGLSESLRRMPESLYQEYIKKPTILNAFKTVIKDASNNQTIEIPGEEGKSIITYNLADSFDTLEILSVQGPAANLPYYKQKEMIIDAWKEIGKQISYEYDNLEDFKKNVKEERNIELDNSPIPEISAESANIKSIKLRQVDVENSYFEVELVDNEGNSLGVFGSPYITDPVNFRREVFGLLQACGTNNFLKLGGQKNASIPITFKCNEREDVIEIHNSHNQTFHQTPDGEYATEPTIDTPYEKYEGIVNSITSTSGVIEMIISAPYFTTFFRTGNIYYGFGYPLISSTNNPDLIKKASNHYKEYIENLLKFLGTDDLLKMGGEVQKLPQVLIERDETGNIIAIGREGEECHLRITDNNYKMEKGKLILTDKNKSKKLI